jgi:hypothetical protein
MTQQQFVAAEKDFQANLVPESTTTLSAQSVKINIHWHVITAEDDDTITGGNIPYANIPYPCSSCCTYEA